MSNAKGYRKMKIGYFFSLRFFYSNHSMNKTVESSFFSCNRDRQRNHLVFLEFDYEANLDVFQRSHYNEDTVDNQISWLRDKIGFLTV